MSPYVALVILAVMAPILAWIFGRSVRAKTLFTLGGIGLVLTAIGIVVIVCVIYPRPFSAPTPPQRNNLTQGFLFLLWVFLGVQIEVLGGILTLTSCVLGLRQTVRRQPRWFWILLVGAFLPLIVSVVSIGIGVFHDIRIQGVSAPIAVAIALPLIAASVTLTFAARQARGARGQIAV